MLSPKKATPEKEQANIGRTNVGLHRKGGANPQEQESWDQAPTPTRHSIAREKDRRKKIEDRKRPTKTDTEKETETRTQKHEEMEKRLTRIENTTSKVWGQGSN